MALGTIGGDGRTTARVEQEIFSQGKDLKGSSFKALMLSALGVSILILVVLIVDVLIDGWPVLSTRLPSFLSGTLFSQASSDQLGISQGLTGTLWIAFFVIGLSFPIGIASAIYLEEYATQSKLTSAIDIAIRNLAGVPSVVYGLLGLFLFVSTNDDESTLFAGGITLAILVLPIVVITSAEAIRAVPSSLKQGAYGVGATKWDVIRTQVLPFAAPGILTGTLLSLSRAIGEAAPLILVGAVTDRLAPRDRSIFSLEQLDDRFTAMPIVIIGWIQDTALDVGFAAAAGAAIVVLLVLVIAMNSVAVLLRSYFERKRG